MKNLKVMMKHLFAVILITIMCSFTIIAQPLIDIGIFASSTPNQIEIRLKPNYTVSSSATNIQYTIKWPISSGIDFITQGSTSYLIEFQGLYTDGDYYYQVMVANGDPATIWIANQEYVIQTFTYDGPSCQIFEIADDAWAYANNGDYWIDIMGAARRGIIYNALATEGTVAPGIIGGAITQCAENLTGQVYSISDVLDATNYTWSVPTGWVIEGGQGTTSITVTTGLLGQNGNISVTADNACGTSSPSHLAVSVSPLTMATPGVISGTTSQCAAKTGQVYSISAVTNATTYTWSVPLGWSITAGNGTTSITVTTGSIGNNGNISVTAGNTCATSSARTLAVSVTSATPTTPLSITGTLAQCPAQTGKVYSISSVANATTYTWTVPTGWSITAGAGTTSITVTTGATGQNGNIRVSAGNTCGTSGLRSLSVTVISTPATPGVISGTANQCGGQTGKVYSISAVTNALTYNWSVPSGWSITSGAGTTSITVTTGSIGNNGNISVTAGNNCGTSSARDLAVTVSSATPATPGIISGSATLCPSVTGQVYSISSVANATTYTWAVPTGWAITAGTGTTSITVTAGSAGQNGNITVTAGNTCGTSASNSLAVIVNSLPDAPSGTSNQTLCSGATVNDLTATGNSIKWYNASTGGTQYLSTDILINATNYYASQTDAVSGCESSLRFPVTATLTVSGKWLGNTNTSWNTASNWCGGVPTGSTNVVIPDATTTPNSPILSTLSEINSLTIEAAGKLTIAYNGKLTVTNDLTNNAGVSGLLIKSTVLGTGSLIHNSSNVYATAECFIPSLDTSYHFISSPITNALSEVFHYAWLYEWNEATQLWNNIVPLNIPITPGKGYSLILFNRGGGNPTESPNNPIIYTGILNNSIVGSDNNISNTDGANASLEGFNLVGNPYPSAIDWDASQGWTKTNVFNAVYFWNDNHYASYINGAGTNGGSKFIPPHQGYFVKRNPLNFGTGTLKMNNSVRVHNSTPYYKSLGSNSLGLQVVGNSYSDETVVRFNTDATINFDGNFDAYKMFGFTEVPQLYTEILDGSLASVNTLPDITDSTIVPLYLKVGKNGIYTINASEINSFVTNTSIILEDKKVATMQLLNTNPVYTFLSDTLDNTNRFLLRFYYNTNKINNIDNKEPIVFSYSKNIYINLNSDNFNNTEMILYNIMGQELVRKEIKNNQLNVVETNCKTGSYFVKIKSGSFVFVKKVHIN